MVLCDFNRIGRSTRCGVDEATFGAGCFRGRASEHMVTQCNVALMMTCMS